MATSKRKTVKLSQSTLATIGADIGVPRYDRTLLSAGILHFGVGNFHRAHQAVYLDDLFNTGTGHDWAIVGAGVMAGEEKGRRLLAGQDWLTTVVEQGAERSAARVTGPMVDFLPPGDTAAILARLSEPAIRIVSLTITEGGYFIDPATGRFDATAEAIATDGGRPESPTTVFGLMAAGLRRRRRAGVAPFTVMSCDNLPHNGAVTRNAVAGVARLSDPDLAEWIAAEVAFPNGMVDRITPATGERERRICAEDYGIDDAWPVFCEDFRQWVLEDHFPAGRPALEAVGVQFVADVTPYENMKIRILNGGHATIAYPAGLLGIELAHEAMGHRLIAGFLDRVEAEEIIPVVAPVPDTDLTQYYRRVRQRFANPKIADTVRRLCLDGSNRQPKFIIPSIADNLARGGPVDGLALVSALWCRYCFGTTQAGETIEANDPNWQRLAEAAGKAREDPAAWLAMKDIYGNVGEAPPFRSAFDQWLRLLWSDGAEEAIRRYLADHD